jgi:hypothetical protein
MQPAAGVTETDTQYLFVEKLAVTNYEKRSVREEIIVA